MHPVFCVPRARAARGSSAGQGLGGIGMPGRISPNCGACPSPPLWKPWRGSASAAARPPMPPPATITGAAFLEEDGDAIEFTFGIDEVDALVRDAKCTACLCIRMVAQAMLYQRAVDALFLVAELDHRKRRRD